MLVKRETKVCAICGTEISLEEATTFHDQTLCPSCLQAHTVICQYCNQRVWDEDIHYDEGQAICPDCFDQHFLTCVGCGRVIHENEARYLDDEEDYPYCHSCYEDREGQEAIHDYSYKPEPIFYGQGPRYFGVELEIDGAGESRSNARALLDIFNQDHRLAYIKHDGSLTDGLEIVTHPLSLDYHLKQAPWQEVMARAVQQGYTSHQAGTCGLHIHISRTAFGREERKQDQAIARILYFFEKHWEELLKFSRRTQAQLNRWASRYGYKEQPREILDHAKKGCHAGRYTCVNLTNDETIEFRIFRGTLKYNTLIATLQLLDKICDVAIFLSDEELKAMSWTTFVSGCQAPELVQYLKERRLYVNEPVNVEEEV